MTETARIDVSEVIDSAPFGAYQKTIVFISLLLMMLDTIHITIISFAAPVIAREWGLHSYDFGWVFGAGLVGNTVGALSLGSAADSIGRRWMVILSVFIYGVFSLLTPLSHSIPTLIVYRFLTGIGLGGMLPNVVAITSEFSPQRIRSFVVSSMSCGLPLGSLLAGIMAATIMPAYGWKATFYVGGIIPIILVQLLIWMFPESIRFLALKKSESPELLRLMRKVAPSRNFSSSDHFFIREARISGTPAKNLFSGALLLTTLLLCVMFFVSYLTLFLLISWLPSLLNEAGIPLQRAIVATFSYFIGGAVGGVALAWANNHWDSRRVLACGFIAGGIGIASLGSSGHLGAIVVLTALFLTGLFVIGTQINLYSVTSATYPTMLRATGLGTAIGVGRIGSIVGPVVAGILLQTGMTVSKLLLLTALPGLIGAIAAYLLSLRKSAEITPPLNAT